MSLGIIMEGDTSELVPPLCELLSEMGLFHEKADSMTPELIEALNVYRTANRIITLDFCDPVTLRTLGIDCGGDELLYLARCAESLSDTELQCYDLCREIVAESRNLGISLVEAANRRNARMTQNVSSWAVTAAVLAFLNK